MSMRVSILWLGLAGLCLPTTGWAADTNVLPPPQISDVALRDGGVLVGQMVNGQNVPQSGIRVSLQDTQNREVAAVVTDRQGGFAISGVRSGVYQLVTPQGRQVYRIWSPGMAPPSAQQGVLIVAPGQTVRGQLGDGAGGGMSGANWLALGAAGAGLGLGTAGFVVAENNIQPASP